MCSAFHLVLKILQFSAAITRLGGPEEERNISLKYIFTKTEV